MNCGDNPTGLSRIYSINRGWKAVTTLPAVIEMELESEVGPSAQTERNRRSELPHQVSLNERGLQELTIEALGGRVDCRRPAAR